MALRLGLKRRLIKPILNQFIEKPIHRGFQMSASRKAEEMMKELKEKNPYYEKYAKKIADLQKTNPEEFLQRVESVEEKSKPKKKEEVNRDYSELLKPKDAASASLKDTAYEKKLSDIMKLELVQDKTAEEIKHIWIEYHKNKDVIIATIPVEQYDLMMNRCKDFPVFIFPIPREAGYEFILLQFFANTIHFTPLLCYQVHKENAPECLTLVHYTELRDKGIVLMRGEYDSKVINVQEAQCLTNQLQLYYSQHNKSKLDLLQQFTKAPDSFKHMDVIKELENLQITT